jgi:hypothetical protein
MKVEWLNDDLTEARLVRGWLRKRYALVHRARSDREGDKNLYWFYDDSGTHVGHDLEHWIDEQRKQGHWKPLTRLPKATVQP